MEARPISREEYEQRVQRVRELIEAEDCDALLITRPQNVYYLCGFRSMGAGLAADMGNIHGLLIPADESPKLFIRSLESKAAEHYSTVESIPYCDSDNPFALVGQALPARCILGVEFTEVRHSQYQSLHQFAEEATFVDVSFLVDRLRATKSPAELAHVRRAGHIADLGMRAAVEALGHGVLVAEVIAAASSEMYRAGQDDINSPPLYVWAGPTGGRMHDTSPSHVIKTGDLVTIEVMGSSELYVANSMGTISIGPRKDLEEAYDTVVRMHDAARAELKPQQSAGTVFSQCDAVHQDSGRGPYRRRVGGCIGINSQPGLFFEGLSISRDETWLLEQGMTVLLQPGIDEPVMMIVASTNVLTATDPEGVTNPLRMLEQR